MKRKGLGARNRRRRLPTSRQRVSTSEREPTRLPIGAFGFGGMGGVPDAMRAEIEAAGFEIHQVGPDDFEAIRWGVPVR